MKKKIFVSIIIFLNIFLQIFPVFAADLETIPVWSNTSDLVIETATDPTFDIASEAGILIELTTGKVLYDKNSHEQLRPASVTKLMTLLLIMEALDSRKNFSNRSSSLFRTCKFYGRLSNLVRC